MKSISPLALIAFITLATGAVGFSVLAEAHPRHHSGGEEGMRGPGRHMDHFAEALGLSEEQIAEIGALREAYRPSLEATANDLHTSQKALHEAIRVQIENASIDDATLAAIGAQIGAAQVEMAATRARMQIEIHSHLTAEQVEMAAELRSHHEGRRGGHPGKMGRRSHGPHHQGHGPHHQGDGPDKGTPDTE